MAVWIRQVAFTLHVKRLDMKGEEFGIILSIFKLKQPGVGKLGGGCSCRREVMMAWGVLGLKTQDTIVSGECPDFSSLQSLMLPTNSLEWLFCTRHEVRHSDTVGNKHNTGPFSLELKLITMT